MYKKSTNKSKKRFLSENHVGRVGEKKPLKQDD